MKEEFQMRTLKKALSLVLVLAMVFTLAVPALAVDKASEFKDYAKVQNKEAVDVLTALGVINGNADGTFGAEGTFTRAQAATMITYLTLGKTVADALPVTGTGFSDVPASFWGAKYIAYCAQEGIISGMGDGKFAPDAKLTAAQWALMLLKAVDAKGADEISGNGYELATTKLAISTKLATADDMVGEFTRDTAAKLAFNSLFYTEKEATQTTTTKYVVLAVAGTPAHAPTAVIGKMYDSFAEATKAATAADGDAQVGRDYTVSAVTVTETTYTDSLAATVFQLSKVSGVNADNYGRPATAWQQKNDKGVNKTIAVCSKTPVATYTTTVSANELYNLLGSKATILKSGSTINKLGATTGVLKADGKPMSSDTLAVSAKSTGIGGNGVITEIYDTDVENQYVVVQIVPTLAKVENVRNIKATATDGAYTRYTISGENYEVYTSNVSGDEKDTLTVNGAIAKGDYVMVYGYEKDGDKYAVATPAELIEGKVTGYTSSNKTFTIGGEKYALSSAVTAADVTATAPTGVTTTKATYAVDAYGYVIGAVEGATTNYVYVLNADKVSYLKDNKVQTVVEAYTIDANGDLQTIVVSKVGSETGLDAMVSALGKVTAEVGIGAKLYSYKLDSDNNYELTVAVEDNVDTITKNSAVMAGNKLKADNNTKYYVANYNSKGVATSVTSYTGYTNVVSLTSVTGTAQDTNGDGIADVVYIAKASETGATASYVYVTGDYSIGEDGKTYYDVITKDGAAEQMKLTGFDGAGLYTLEGGKATKVATKQALVVDKDNGTDGIYGTAVSSVNKFFTYQNGLLMASKDDNTYEYLASISGDTAVYYYVDGAVSDEMTTAADMNGATGSQIVFALNATKTAVEAVYIVK